MKNAAVDKLIKKASEQRRFYKNESITELDTAYGEWDKGNYIKDSNPNSETYGYFIDINLSLAVCRY